MDFLVAYTESKLKIPRVKRLTVQSGIIQIDFFRRRDR